jgi:hypothetical protein
MRFARLLTLLAWAAGSCLGLVCLAPLNAQQASAIDWTRAQELHNRVQRGEKLSPEDQAYYDRARQARGAGQGGEGAQNNGRGRGMPANLAPAPPPRDSTGMVPLVDLSSGSYKGESGGLYGDGQNEPPAAHRQAALKLAEAIKPLNRLGFADPQGKVVLLSIGMSNTTQEFSAFKPLADADSEKSPALVIVDGAQGGQAAIQWDSTEAPAWARAEERLLTAGVTPEQVQVVWIKQALVGQGQYGEFPAHARRFADELIKVLNVATERYPNLRLAYLSSRIYAGYATTPLNPEPFAYEGAFSVRWVIQSQIKRDNPQLNYDPQRGEVQAPLVLWGPYLWADGVQPRKTDGLVYTRENLIKDGTHPSESGRHKVAEQLLKFMKTDETARRWFVATTSGSP